MGVCYRQEKGPRVRQEPRKIRANDDQELKCSYALKELPQPQVLLTLGLLNLKPAPSTVSI